MLFSRLKNKTEKPLPSDELDRETIARWKAIAAESKEEANYKTITLDNEAVLPDVKSYQEERPRSAQLSFDSVQEVEMESEEMTASWPTVDSFGGDSFGDDSFGESVHNEVPHEAGTQQEAEMLTAETYHETQPQDDIAFVDSEEEVMAQAVESFEEPFTPEIAATPVAQSVARADLSLPAEEDIKRRFGDNIRSALGPGTVIDGTFRFDSPVCVDGTLTGEVCSSSALIVGPHATIEASIIVGSLIIQGTVIGDIEADELVEIRAGAEVQGNIETRRIVMEDGALFSGKCRMLG